ncbi:transglycosylase domain-containing protein [Methylobacterium currus]|uniref:transglycosylase domain-containing protein n=1 Tax=Methylobacterium currus TaxID=2051553 RepID=UPI001E5900BD|nr:transglycosylase domain-containing protein [Methylobacterium currus]UHC19406.1 transglycosylase domain-containing protein [Methylobacterium currus]
MTTQPGRDWLDLSSPPQPPPERPEASSPSRVGPARSRLPPGVLSLSAGLAQVRAGAARAGSQAAGHLQPVLAAAAGPLRRVAPAWQGAAERVGAHPLAARAAGAARRAGALPWGRALLLAGLGGASLAALFLVWCAATLPPLSGSRPSPRTLTIQAEDGTPVARRDVVRGQPLPLDAVSPAMRQAFLAAQDPWFEDGYRLDAAGVAAVIGRAFRDTISDGPRSGGPRLTQRLVRRDLIGAAPGQPRSLADRVREAMLVLWLSLRESDARILARALDLARFGPGLTGIDAAARALFNKAAASLDTPEAAYLAGLTLAPGLQPDRDVNAARALGHAVLDGMVMRGTLGATEAGQAGRALDGLSPVGTTPVTRSGFPDLVLAEAAGRLGPGWPREAVLRTTLDRDLQAMAETAVERRLDAAGRGGARAGFLALGPDGGVQAVVAGGASLVDTPEARRAASASLRHLGRDGRPVYDRLVAGPMPAAERRTALLGLLAGLARPPESTDDPSSRDGLFIGPVGDLLVGTYLSGAAAENGAGDGPEALFQDFSAQVAKARPAPPVSEAREGARETGSTTRPAPRPAWQNPGERPTAAPALRGVPRVIDTGRLRLDGQSVRLAGVEGQGGTLAREFRQYLRRREVTCQPAGGADLYRCRAGDQDLSEVVLFNGAGRAAPGAPPDLQAAEASAKARKAGVWQ